MARPREFEESDALGHALETFRSGSFASTSTQDLCEATGLSRSSLYNTFQSKHELYRLSLQRYVEERDEDRATYLQMRGTGRSVLERLLLEAVSNQQDRVDQRGCLVVNAAVELGRSDVEVAALARRNLTEFQALLAEVIARGQDDGSLASALPPSRLAALVHATLNGLEVAARVADDERVARATVRTLMNLL